MRSGVLDAGGPDLAAASSKTFRSPARLTVTGLRQLIAFISKMTASDRAEWEGVNADRASQIGAAALVAEVSMRALGIETVDICPCALRERSILRKLDSEADGSGAQAVAVRDA